MAYNPALAEKHFKPSANVRTPPSQRVPYLEAVMAKYGKASVNWLSEARTPEFQRHFGTGQPGIIRAQQHIHILRKKAGKVIHARRQAALQRYTKARATKQELVLAAPMPPAKGNGKDYTVKPVYIHPAPLVPSTRIIQYCPRHGTPCTDRYTPCCGLPVALIEKALAVAMATRGEFEDLV